MRSVSAINIPTPFPNTNEYNSYTSPRLPAITPPFEPSSYTLNNLMQFKHSIDASPGTYSDDGPETSPSHGNRPYRTHSITGPYFPAIDANRNLPGKKEKGKVVVVNSSRRRRRG